jgi:hypothetical protein
MERGEKPKSLVEVVEISEDVRIYSSSYLQDTLAHDIVSGILSHPYVASVTPEMGKPNLSVIVGVEDPEHWHKHVDPHCRETIEMAFEAQNMYQ